jgi:hypothetical protein
MRSSLGSRFASDHSLDRPANHSRGGVCFILIIRSALIIAENAQLVNRHARLAKVLARNRRRHRSTTSLRDDSLTPLPLRRLRMGHVPHRSSVIRLVTSSKPFDSGCRYQDTVVHALEPFASGCIRNGSLGGHFTCWVGFDDEGRGGQLLEVDGFISSRECDAGDTGIFRFGRWGCDKKTPIKYFAEAG